MKHAKFVSFTEVGAQTAREAAALLPDFLTERYARTVDPLALRYAACALCAAGDGGL